MRRMKRNQKVRAGALIPVVLLLVLGAVTPTVLSAQGLDFLPRNVRERIDEVEAARVAWEDQRSRVISRLDIQPWEEEDEYARRVERAVARGAGREYRFLQFQLAELEQYTFSVESARIDLLPEERPEPGHSWTIQVRTDLGFLPEQDQFAISVDPAERERAQTEHYDIARALENNSLQGRISYVLAGHPDGSYQITLERIHLLDANRPGPAFRSVPVNRHYAFSPYERIAVTQPSIRFAFLDGAVPPELEMAGSVPWRIVGDHAYAGDYVLRAGEIDHDEYSEVRFPQVVPAGATRARIAFAVRTSSERRYDLLGFYLNNERIDEWSGPLDWELVTYHVDLSGMTRLDMRWRYEKDGSVSEGEDTAWIDDIRIEFE